MTVADLDQLRSCSTANPGTEHRRSVRVQLVSGCRGGRPPEPSPAAARPCRRPTGGPPPVSLLSPAMTRTSCHQVQARRGGIEAGPRRSAKNPAKTVPGCPAAVLAAVSRRMAGGAGAVRQRLGPEPGPFVPRCARSAEGDQVGGAAVTIRPRRASPPSGALSRRQRPAPDRPGPRTGSALWYRATAPSQQPVSSWSALRKRAP